MGNSFRRRNRRSNNTDSTNNTENQPNNSSRPVDQQQQEEVAEEQRPRMENNQDSDSSAGSGDDVPGSDLASILQFLLQSGQVRLVRARGLGAFEVNVNPSGIFDSSDEEELGQRTPPSPDRNYTPDLSNMNDSQIKSIVQTAAGHYHSKPKNVTSRLQQREQGTLRKRQHYTRADYAIIDRNYLPNECETMAKYHSKAFCGTYSSDGNVFMSACQDQHIRLYDTTKGQFKMFRNIAARDVGWSIVDTAYSPDQHYIIYSSWSDFIHQCNVYGDHNTHLALDLRPQDSRFCAFSISFSADSKEIIAGKKELHKTLTSKISCSDRCLYIYDREKDARTLRFHAHDDDVNAVTFSGESSNILVSGGDDGVCKIWDRRTLSESTPKPVGMFAGHADGITYVSDKGDERYYITNSKDQSIKLWDTRRFSNEETIKEKGTPQDVDVENQIARRLVAKQHWDYRWSSVPRRSQRLQKGLRNDAVMTYRGHSVLHTLLRAKFSPPYHTGQQFIYTGCATGSVVVYDILTGEIVKKLKGGHKQCVRDVSWHPYENIIMSSSWDTTVGKWEYSAAAVEDAECDALHHGDQCSDGPSKGGTKRKRLRTS